MAFDESDKKFYFVHSLYAGEVEDTLSCLNDFCDMSNEEVIILDFQHFYDFDKTKHKLLKDYLLREFGDKFYGRNQGKTELKDITLEKVAQLKKQIIVIYREDSELIDQFWYSAQWPTQWPNVTTTENLKASLESKLKRRKFKQGIISQAILTPDLSFILLRFWSTLRKQCAIKVQNDLYKKWLPDRMPGEFTSQQPPTWNVIIADFVDLNYEEFVHIVINLNFKLLKDKSEEVEQ